MRPPVPARVTPLADARRMVELLSPEESVAPGQACVFYERDGTRVLGGGWIARAQEPAGSRGMKRFDHVLIVGGSGMLAGLARSLCDHAAKVSVLARNEKRIRAIGDAIEPIACDYNDGVALSEALSQIEVARSRRRLDSRPRAACPPRASPNACVAEGRFVQVLGSAHADPAHPERLAEMEKAVEGLPIDHQTVVLGFVVGDRQVALADQCGNLRRRVRRHRVRSSRVSIVGTVEPWSAKP